MPNLPGLSVSPDGNWVATLFNDPPDSPDQVVRVCSAVTGRERFRFTGGGRDGGVSFSPDGRWLATTSIGGFVVCRADTGAEQYRVRFDPGFVNLLTPVGFSPDGRYLAVGVENAGTIWIHDVLTRQQTQTWRLNEVGIGHSTFSLTFSPDGTRLVVSSERGVTMWRVEGGEYVWGTQVNAATTAFSADGRRVVTAGEDGVHVLDAHDGSRRMTLAGRGTDGFGSNTCEFTSDGTRLLTAREDAVQLWDASTGQELLTLPVKGARSAAMTADGRRIVWTSMSGLVHVVDVSSPDAKRVTEFIDKATEKK